MKQFSLFLSLGLMIYILSGCTYWTMSGDTPDREIAENESVDNNQYEFNIDSSPFDKIELNLSVDVGDIKLVATDSNQFFLKQNASRGKKVFLIPTVTESGKTLKLFFKSPSDVSLHIGNNRNDITVELPKSILYKLDISNDIGKTSLDSDELQIESASVNSDVGDIEFKLNNEQDELEKLELGSDVGKILFTLNGNAPSLESIKLQSDVGDINSDLNGNFDVLNELNFGGDTGKIKAQFAGNFSHALSSEIGSDVGNVSIIFDGNFSEGSEFKTYSSTGNLDISMKKDIPTKLVFDEDEYVSKAKIENIAFDHVDNNYYLCNASESDFTLLIRASSDVGGIKISK